MLKNKIIAPILFLYHMIWMVVAYIFINHDGGDAIGYWWLGVDTKDISWFEIIQPGTNIIKAFTFPLAQIFQVPFIFGFILFALWSFWGWHLLLKFFQNLELNNLALEILALAFLFSPNQHFWTSLLGKEAMLWTPLVILIINILNQKCKNVGFVLSFILILFIRPHIAIIVGLGIGLYFILKTKGTLLQRVYIIMGVVFLTITTFYLLDQIMLGNDSVMIKIQNYYNAYNRVLRYTDGYVPLEDYNLFFKIWTFYFRPYLTEASSWLYWFVGVENTVALLYVLIFLVLFFKFKIYSRLQLEFVILLMIGIGLTLMYVYAYANYGLILRTKVLIIPFFIIPMFLGYSNRNK